MTNDEQRIAIAEATGRYMRDDNGSGVHWHDAHHGMDVLHMEDLPDYLNDLNAMHEAEATLTSEQRERFVIWLRDHNPTGEGLLWNIAHATAAQRAEAFLKTIGRWKE